MGNLVVVGISDQQIVSHPDILITYALGSCVGICLHDALCQIAGMAHILLPAPCSDNCGREPFKYANSAVEALVRAMEQRGCHRCRLTAKIAGGATMFAATGISIGDRNVEMVKHELERLNIRLLAEDTGSNYGRTIDFKPACGTMTVRSVGRKTVQVY